ncbi:DUF6894 family protein [Sphingomonas sp.]|jgi:hypothetical protein|uniref:DUF6894 family protein n=1 Tax=Sphingomonas sp. TaxID=28214 RepID=UPI002EDA1887
MARYFFHLYNDEVTLDEEGSELPDDSAAIEWAKREVRFEASESIKRHAHLVRSHHIVVEDQTRREVGTVGFGDVISVRD